MSRRLRQLGLPELSAYRGYLESHQEEWDALDAMCRISISRFFRDRRMYAALASDILPRLARQARERALSVWSAGCACGEEPYSVVLAWHLGSPEDGRPGAAAESATVQLSVTATDASAQLLERARRGRYPSGNLKELPPSWIDHAFSAHGGEYVLRREIMKPVAFYQQDLRHRWPEEPFDLVLCRNSVLTYFEPSLQREVMAEITARIRSDGALVIGCHEELPSSLTSFRRWQRGLPIFIRPEGTASRA